MGFSDPTFWQNFWPNFWSDLFVGIVIAGLVSWLLSRSKKTDVKVDADIEPFSKAERKLEFGIKNTGRVSFRSDEIFWHVFVDSKLYAQLIPERPDTPAHSEETMGSKSFIEFKGLLQAPVFPGRRTHLFSVRVKASEIDQADLKYFLSTAHGLFPKGIKFDEAGNIVPKTLGRVTIYPEVLNEPMKLAAE